MYNITEKILSIVLWKTVPEHVPDRVAFTVTILYSKRCRNVYFL